MKKLVLLICSILSISSFAETGILFIAHGTMGGGHGDHHQMSCSNEHPSKWESYILSTLAGMKNEIPKNFEVSFGMWESQCFDESIHRLETKLANQGSKLDHLVIFPLFISSYSSVIEMQKYIFKKRSDRVLDIPNVRKTYFEGKITYMPAFDYDPHISMILTNRFEQLINMAQEKDFSVNKMELVLVMHGPVEDDANLEWIKMGERYNKDITSVYPVAKSHIISLRDDADQEVKDQMTKEFRKIVSNANEEGKIALILPLLISKNGIDASIIERLNELEYIWSGESIFPDEKLKDAILHKLKFITLK
ncbi:MAG: hypothetical protein PHY93_12535 [Bacteriovorax sp.]|nr:hypothetical protein [Bacteriovorax sp.]